MTLKVILVWPLGNSGTIKTSLVLLWPVVMSRFKPTACSPFFQSVLRQNPHQHPLIYLKGVKLSDLKSVLDFMYHGEVNVAEEELNSFLAVSKQLRVKGLTQSNDQSNRSFQVKEQT